MREIYKKSYIYNLLKIWYNLVNENYAKILNYKYRKSVNRLIQSNEIDQKIAELDNIIFNRETATYYIIRRENKKIGLLTYVSIFLGHIAYAVEKGYIPIIDMKNFQSIYHDEKKLLLNAWELYFEQPCGISLDDIPKSANVIYSPKLLHPLSPFISSLFDEKESNFWKKLSNRFIRLNDFCNKYYQNEYNILIKDKKVLGLLYRGTDYLSLRPRNHPIQPSIEDFITQVDNCISEWGDFDYYYIATEDNNIVKALKIKYGDKIITNDRVYYDEFKNFKYLADVHFDRDNDNFLKGLEYLSSIKLISSTDYIIAGMCAGTYGANFLKPTNFKKSYFFDLGVYK